MFLSLTAFGLCVLFLFCTVAAQVVAARNGDKRRLRGLHLVTLGLSLSACAYLFHSAGGPAGSPLSLLSLLFRFGGITFLWLAWQDHWARQREQLAPHAGAAHLVKQENDEGPPFQTPLPPEYQSVYAGLNSRAREAFCAAQEEALRQGRCCVETDHLLLGLLQVPHCAACRILEQSQVTADKVRGELAKHKGEVEGAVTTPALSPRVRQALAMAEIEAHRFGKTFVGTEHLLLGLLLVGTGPAASALFASGLTVDEIRREIIASAK